jgi:hypothetical protein
VPHGEPHKASITLSGYAVGMKNKVNGDPKTILAAIDIQPTTVETVRKVLIKHIDGVKVVLQEAEMVFSMN